MVKKGEKGVPRSAETRIKIGIGARNTRLSEKKPCRYGCGKILNSGNMVTHIRKFHEFICKMPGCINDGVGKTGLGYCQRHYSLSAFCTKVGTTVDEYLKVFQEQGGRCKLCPREGTLRGEGGVKVEVLVIDHCHTSGEFRGLLCHRCNIGLGQFKDDIAVLQNAIDYLKGTL
jgi:hypothetical protein